MNVLQLLPVLVVGLAGSVHCIGMCGGIVGALSAVPSPAAATTVTTARRIPIAVAGAEAYAGGAMPAHAGASASPCAGVLARTAAYNAGRIASYMVAGALAGGLAGGAQQLTQMTRLAGLQMGLYWMANLMLVALGLYLMGAWLGLARLERGGQLLWRRAQVVLGPLMKTLVPVDRPAKAFLLGGLWGWVPCGMVYSVLLTAMLSGSAASGAAVMLAFGLGTLPMLTALGLAGERLRRALRRPRVRTACGLLVLGFGLLGLTRAATGISPAWLDALCLTGHP